MLTSITGLILSSNSDFNDYLRFKNLHSFHHFLYTIMVFMSPCVVLCYWFLVHEEHLEEIKEDCKGDEYKRNQMFIHTCIVHSVPFMCAIWLMILNDTVLMRKHSKCLAIVGILYGISNYNTTMRSGKPLYGFLPWNDGLKTPLTCAAIISFFTMMFYVSAVIDEFITGRCPYRGKVQKSK